MAGSRTAATMGAAATIELATVPATTATALVPQEAADTVDAAGEDMPAVAAADTAEAEDAAAVAVAFLLRAQGPTSPTRC